MRVCVGESGAQFDAEARESMGGGGCEAFVWPWFEVGRA